MKLHLSSIVKATFAIVFLFSLLLAGGCNLDGGGSLYNKLSPETRLSNVPPNGIISQNPRLSLAWVGDDADGYVVAFKYRWNFRLSAADTFQYKPWTTILNVTINNLANLDGQTLALVMMGDETVAPKVYKYFSTLPPEGLDISLAAPLILGDTILIEGVRVFASNPDGERYPIHTNPRSGTFIFDSQDILNPHTFEVASIDNDGMVDQTPAQIFFQTPQVAPPSTDIDIAPSDTALVLDYKTDTFNGIRFTFFGIDENSRTLDFQWVIDKDIWQATTGRVPWSDFSSSTEAYVTAADFPDKYAINHRFYVRARNEFGSIDTLGYYTRVVNLAGGGTRVDTIFAHRDFYTVYPGFKRPGYSPKTLLINNSYDFDTSAILPGRPNYQALEQYYRDIYNALGKTEGVDYVMWRVRDQGFPGRGLLGQFDKIHFFGDVVNFVNFKWSKPAGTELFFGPGPQRILLDYCYIGGKLIFNGWNSTRVDQTSPQPEFWNNVLHISTQQAVELRTPVSLTPAFFYGAFAQAGSGYPDAPLDETKADTATAWRGGLPAFFWYQLSGFGEIIYRLNARTPGLDGLPLGVRYLGITYDTFFFGFPLYYVDKTSAIALVRKAHEEFDSPH